MAILEDTSLAGMHFTISWDSDGIHHEENYYVPDANMWRDIFPDPIRRKLIGSKPGDTIEHSLRADGILDGKPSPYVSLTLSHWRPLSAATATSIPLAGRYYPQGFLQGIAGIYPQTITPMRVVTVDGDTIILDMNHPLAGRELDIRIKLHTVSHNPKERGGRCSDHLQDILADGPGMQARYAAIPITFDPATAYLRADSARDEFFYTQPRIVSHIDSQAGELLATTCGQLLRAGDRVLDLMASVDSHLPGNLELEVTGLGLNREEMSANRSLKNHVIHDLNGKPALPFPDSSFDAVLCHLSIEYLTSPQKVIRDIARVLKTSGILAISFSNRWFPPKVTRLWTELHEFERLGYVTQLCWPFFDNLETRSFRNWPRPQSDRHFPGILKNDPLYLITGKAKPLVQV
jgi:SAM-dependent methyltransferase